MCFIHLHAPDTSSSRMRQKTMTSIRLLRSKTWRRLFRTFSICHLRWHFLDEIFIYDLSSIFILHFCDFFFKTKWWNEFVAMQTLSGNSQATLSWTDMRRVSNSWRKITDVVDLKGHTEYTVNNRLLNFVQRKFIQDFKIIIYYFSFSNISKLASFYFRKV